jgi:hypothetical protein
VTILASTNMAKARELERWWATRGRHARLVTRKPRRAREAPLERRGATIAAQLGLSEPRGPVHLLAETSMEWARRRQREVEKDPMIRAKRMRAKMARASEEMKYDAKKLQELGEEEKATWVKGYGWRFPIVDREDLKVAIAALGTIPLELMPAARKFISRRARELMMANLLPSSWPDN